MVETAEALAPRHIRFAAGFIDEVLLIGVPAGIVLATNPMAASAVVVIARLIFGVAMPIRSGERNGQTLGKQLLGLRIVAADQDQVTLRLAVKRQLGRLILGVIWLIFDMAIWLRDSHRQAYSDGIAATYVLREGANPRIATQLIAHADLPRLVTA